jgi:hypothetical protein
VSLLTSARTLILRLWKDDKLLLILSAILAYVAVWSVFAFADEYRATGWRALLLPAMAAYFFFRVLQYARMRASTLGKTNTADDAKQLKRFLRMGASTQQFEALVAEDGPKLLAHRASLWAEAPSSLRTAHQLQQEIQDELTALDDVIASMAKHTPHDREEMEGLAQYRKEVEQELERAVELVRYLRA